MYSLKVNNITRPVLRASMFVVLALTGISNAFALPSFARQTGESCDACHVGSFGPQLTTHGMKFKLGGYTESDGKPGHIPLAAMLIESYTHTQEDQDPNVEGSATEGFSKNNNLAMQELSGFLAGKLVDHVGAFAQVTYSEIGKETSLDNTDFRFATDNLFGEGSIFGVSLNNNPTMQDPFNTLPAWRFPYTSSEFGPGPEVGVMLDDGVAGQVFGTTAYALLANGLYAEFGGYHALSEGFLKKVNVGAEAEVRGFAPYVRLAFFKDMKSDTFSLGVVGMSAKVRDYAHLVPTEKVSDIGVDGHYQFLGNRTKIGSLNFSYIHENGPQDANQLSLAGSYYFDKSYGATVRYLRVSATDAESGDDLSSNGWTLQADWTPFGKESSWQAPWANLRVGLQYTLYNKLNGDSSNASDANTMMLFGWLSL